MRVDFFVDTALLPALRLLPLEMGSPAGMAMVVAICLQESRLTQRRQINGPARGYAQFERGGGVWGVVTHPLTRARLAHVCGQLDISPDSAKVYEAIEFNDILACALARLLLWTLPQGLPNADQPEEGWRQYLAAWRPGKPHRTTWDAFYEQAWQAVAAATRNAP